MPPCLYCRREDRKFTSVEHLVPEGLGNKDIVLPVGVVCDKCNNEVLSQLDKALIEFGPIALLRVKYGVPTKAGKMPQAKLRDAIWRRTSAGHVHIRANSKKNVWERPGGFGFKFYDRRPMNARRTKELTRVLFKMALGLIYLEEGPDAALSERFDPIRQMIRGKTPFHGYLRVAANEEYIRRGFTNVSIRYEPIADPDKRTILFILDYAGVVLVTDLETRDPDLFTAFSEEYSLFRF
jgi:hypothetical protein